MAAARRPCGLVVVLWFCLTPSRRGRRSDKTVMIGGRGAWLGSGAWAGCAFVAAAVEALSVSDQHGGQVVVVPGAAFQTACGVEPEFQSLVMHATKAHRTVGHLLLDHCQLAAVLAVIGAQLHSPGGDVHPPVIRQAEADPLAAGATDVHAATPGGLHAMGLAYQPAAVLFHHIEIREDRQLPGLPYIVKQALQLAGRLQHAVMLLAAGAHGPVTITPVNQPGHPL